jgi:hypothetical protein
MPKYTRSEWSWEEAFDKFGFDDGDGIVMTWKVIEVLNEAGYILEEVQWGMHNTIIDTITTADGTLIFGDGVPNESVSPGYTDPREVLPADLVKFLDETLPGPEYSGL